MPRKRSHSGKSTQTEVVTTAAKAIDDLALSPRVASALKDIQSEVADAYRDSFIEMLGLVRQQTSTLARIQETLHILVTAIRPTLAESVPTAVRIAKDGESPDLASALVVADPIGAGFTLSQADVARALNLPNSTDVSILLRAFKLDASAECAVTVRRGTNSKIVNYHPRSVDRFLECVAAPPPDLSLTADQQSALKRIRKKLQPKATTSSK